MKTNIKFLRDLINVFGTSGDEERVRDLIQKEIKPFVDEIFIDNMGNLIAVRKGKKPKIMISAHMDEVGLMIKRINERGFIYCTMIGDIDTALIVGQVVHINTKKGPIHGVITTTEVSAGKWLKRIPNIEELIIDTGLSKAQLEELGVEIGSYVNLENKDCCFAENNLIFGKALDNRLGCFAVVELAKRIKKNKLKRDPEIYYVFTVQEEIGLRGAKASAFEIKPDWGIVVDTTHANDSFTEPTRFIGRGPCLTIKDGEFIGNKCINDWLKNIAKKKNIPLQLEAIEMGTTDAATIQTTAGGVPTAALTIPVRNLHTTIGIASLQDIENAVLILEELLKDPPLVCLV